MGWAEIHHFEGWLEPGTVCIGGSGALLHLRIEPSQIRALTDPWWVAEVFDRGVGMGGLHSGVAVDDSRLVWLDLYF